MPPLAQSPPPARWQRTIREYIAAHPDRPLKTRALARALDIPEQHYVEFRRLVRQMLADGSLVYGPGRALRLPQQRDTLLGVFRAHRRGFGFLEVPGRPDLYVPRNRRHGAWDGDTVEARLLRPRGRFAEPRAEIVRVVARARTRWVGVLTRHGSHWTIEPFGRTPLPPITVVNPTAASARPGDMVVLEPTADDRGRTARGVIVENLGPAEHPQAKLRALVHYHGLRDAFEQRVREAAERAAATLSSANLADRLDLRELPAVTIDPPDARDFDDAISLRRLPGGLIELGVHIADVAYFVKPGDVLDEEARRRGTSVYFPGYALPMLPEALSADACSLRPDTTRLTKSVLITYDRRARVCRTRLAESVIRSRARLTYGQVDAVLAGEDGGVDRKIVGLLKLAARLAERIRARRRRAGMLELAAPELEIRLDAAGRVVGAGPAIRGPSHGLIEMFMVEANEVVARTLSDAGVPFLRRVHPELQPEAAESFARIVGALGLRVAEGFSRAGLLAVLERVRGQPSEPVISTLLLRCLPQAYYSPDPQGHFALASEHYCHSTSPIRRYPDLTVQRAIQAYLAGRSGSRRHTGRDLPSLEELTAIGAEASAGERRAQQAERDAGNLLVLELIKSRVGQVFDGIVTGVISLGVFVQIFPHLAEGMVRRADLGPEQWYFDRSVGRFVGRYSGRVVAIGQRVRVMVTGVDELRQELSLAAVPGQPLGEGARRRQVLGGQRRAGHRRAKKRGHQVP